MKSPILCLIFTLHVFSCIVMHTFFLFCTYLHYLYVSSFYTLCNISVSCLFACSLGWRSCLITVSVSLSFLGNVYIFFFALSYFIIFFFLIIILFICALLRVLSYLYSHFSVRCLFMYHSTRVHYLCMV